MLFSYLNVDKKTELRYRRAKAMENRLNKRDLKILSQERVMRYEQSLSVEEFVRGILAVILTQTGCIFRMRKKLRLLWRKNLECH